MSNEKTYTEEEAKHLIAREVAKQRLDDVERQVGSLKNDISKGNAETSAKIDSLRQTLTEQIARLYDHVSKDKEDLKEEFKDMFASHTDLIILEAKVEKMWLKVSIPVATITAVVNFIFLYIGAK